MSVNRIIKTIKRNKSFLISTHVNPDPDALCSELALMLYLKSLGKKVLVINAEKVPKRYAFLPCSRLIRKFQNNLKTAYDAAILVDCGDLDRIGKVKNLIDKRKVLINIDHHVTNDSFGDINLIEPKASSTAEVLFDLFKRAKGKLTKDIAVLLYLGIMTDTGSFRYDSTTGRTHEVISRLMKFDFPVSELYRKLYETVPYNDLKLFTRIVNNIELLHQGKVVYVELRKDVLNQFSGAFDLREKIFTYLRSIAGVEVLVILTEHDKTLTRANFRSQGAVNVAELASFFKGGGHKKASGCVLSCPLKEAKKRVFQKLRKFL